MPGMEYKWTIKTVMSLTERMKVSIHIGFFILSLYYNVD